MKIALCTGWNIERDGIADYSRYFAEGLGQCGVEVSIVPLGHYIDDLDFYRKAAAEANKADVIHVQFNYLYFNGEMPYRNRYCYLRSLLRKPVVMTCHEIRPALMSASGALSIREIGYNSTLWLWNMLSRRFHEKMYASSNALIVHSQIQKTALLPYIADQEKINIIPHGIPLIDEAVRTQPPGEAKGKFGFAGKTVLMVYGFINKKKGYECILDALAILGPEYALIIAGGKMSDNAVDNAYEKYLMRMIVDKGLAERIHITGYVDARQSGSIFAATDICLAPFSGNSASGALSLCIAYQKPIIASAIPLHEEICRQFACMELFPAGSSEKLAAAIQALAQDPVRQKALSVLAGSYGQKNSYVKVAAATTALYKEIIR